jgi:hypothetical protein
LKLAVIPPKGLEERMAYGDMVMALAPQCNYDAYYKQVRKLCKEGKYVILDNGANEGAAVTYEKINDLALDLGVREVVLSDVLGDGEQTIQETTKHLSHLSKTLFGTHVSLMAVVQGNSKHSQVFGELKTCVAAFSQMTRIRTLGIPRHLITPARKTVRIDLAHWVEDAYPNRFKIHFLGTSPVWTTEAYMAAKYTNARSIDTSMPYNYAQQRIPLSSEAVNVPLDAWRLPHYFTQTHILTPMMLHNERVLRDWCNGIKASASRV